MRGSRLPDSGARRRAATKRLSRPVVAAVAALRAGAAIMPPNRTGPLDGVTVLDLCSYLAGPYGSTLLADLGATVIKAINPRLVYCGLTGYGDRGPLSEKGGFDQVLQCLSGIAVFQVGGPDRA
jgi:crotonobetainyl-CoA:carnitine CoA-transferase CaiB-like acyl-CoA transferase